MPITDLLERNSKLYGNEVALVEINPQITEQQRVTWKEYQILNNLPICLYDSQVVLLSKYVKLTLYI